MTDIDRATAKAEADLFAELLRELREAHHALVYALREMEAVTSNPAAADRLRCSGARWRLSNASLSRRVLWQRIHRSLSSCVLGADMRTLAELQETDLALLRASAQHVRTWTAAALDERWAEYCAASRDIRWKMKAAMSAEQRMLYPLLERCSRGARARAA
jgi:hypothetical protein